MNDKEKLEAIKEIVDELFNAVDPDPHRLRVFTMKVGRGKKDEEPRLWVITSKFERLKEILESKA